MLEFDSGLFNANNDDGYIDLYIQMSGESNMYSRMVQGISNTDTSFGSLLFNSPEEYTTYYELNFGMEFNFDKTESSSESAMNTDLGFDADLEAVNIVCESGMSAVLTRDVTMPIEMSSSVEMIINPAYYQQSHLELVGEFKPGDRIVIDAAALKITRNGENALHYLSGEFFDLNLGPNEIVYTDDAAARNVLIRVTHRDQFM